MGLGESFVDRLVRQRDGLWELALVRRRMTCGKEVLNIVKERSISYTQYNVIVVPKPGSPDGAGAGACTGFLLRSPLNPGT